MKRLLLPFTHGIDEKAIDNVLRFARASEITLVALALVSAPDESYRERLRPERVEQATDFLETISAYASLYGVAVEQHEAYTLDIAKTIHTVMLATESQGILLIIKEDETCLLQADEASQMQQALETSFYKLYIPASRKTKKKFAVRPT